MTTPSVPIPVHPPVPTQPFPLERGEGPRITAEAAKAVTAQAAASWHAGVASVPGVVTVK